MLAFRLLGGVRNVFCLACGARWYQLCRPPTMPAQCVEFVSVGRLVLQVPVLMFNLPRGLRKVYVWNFWMRPSESSQTCLVTGWFYGLVVSKQITAGPFFTMLSGVKIYGPRYSQKWNKATCPTPICFAVAVASKIRLATVLAKRSQYISSARNIIFLIPWNTMFNAECRVLPQATALVSFPRCISSTWTHAPILWTHP